MVRLEIGDWRMENGEWRMGNGEWGAYFVEAMKVLSGIGRKKEKKEKTWVVFILTAKGHKRRKKVGGSVEVRLFWP